MYCNEYRPNFVQVSYIFQKFIQAKGQPVNVQIYQKHYPLLRSQTCTFLGFNSYSIVPNTPCENEAKQKIAQLTSHLEIRIKEKETKKGCEISKAEISRNYFVAYFYKKKEVLQFSARKREIYNDYGRPMKAYFIEIQNFQAWEDKLGR